jgi:hypothetical protein
MTDEATSSFDDVCDYTTTSEALGGMALAKRHLSCTQRGHAKQISYAE